jgi:succinate dehydrogenase / fumarate reductase flavoprotein subunit
MSYTNANITKRKFDVVIVGAGGSGMRAALQLARAGLNVASLSKVFPTRSHTVAAQGGVGASLGNMSEDNWHYHFYDTVKGSDWLGDQDAIEFMCREAPKVVYELEHFGMPFDRNPDGTIYQRPFGGHTANYGEKPVQRACAAADRTGHAMLHTLYQQNVKAKTNFFVEWMALDLIRDADGDVVGVTALEMETGDLYILEAKTVLLATGGAGRIFAAIHQRLHQHRRRPGHGGARRHSAARHGVLAVPPHRRGRCRRAADRRLPRRRRHPAQQQRRALHGALRAHPEGPGTARLRVALDGPGNQGRPWLRSQQGLRHAQARPPGRRHHPQAPALGVRNRRQLRQRRHHQGTDPRGAHHPLPDGWHPHQHQRPGGHAKANGNEQRVVNGLYAVGECACVSVHGANRLGTNSLLDLLVFGKAAGNHIVEFNNKNKEHKPCPDAADRTLERLNRSTSPATANTRKRGQRHPRHDAAARRRVPHPGQHGRRRGRRSPSCANAWRRTLKDKSKVFNTARIEALEVDNLIEVAQATMVSAAARKECRGAHTVYDYEHPADHPSSRWAATTRNWMKHTLWYSEGNRLDYKPVNLKPLTVDSVPPKVRTF